MEENKPEMTDGQLKVSYRLLPSARLAVLMLVYSGAVMFGGSFAAFNFAIVCMVNSTQSTFDLDSNATDLISVDNCPLSVVNQSIQTESVDSYNGEFIWDRETQSNLLASQSCGALILGLPMGLLADRYGSKFIMLACAAVLVLTNALTPVAAYASVTWLFVVRIIQGLAQGATYPATLSVLSRWATSTDVSLFLAVSNTGYQSGRLIAMASSSSLCASGGRWPSVFYLWAALSGLFLLVWQTTYCDDPARCRFISRAELTFVTEGNVRKLRQCRRVSLRRVPWRQALLAPTVVCIYVAQFGSSWTILYILEFLPLYAKEVLRLPLANNGLASSLPQLVQGCFRVLAGVLADRLTFGGRSRTFSVKVFTVFCLGGASACLFAVAFLDCRHAFPAIVLFCLCSACISTNSVAFLRSILFVAAPYAGLIGAISNTYGNAAGVVMPYVVGALLQSRSVNGWQIGLLLSGVLALICCLQFLLLGTAEEQRWAGGGDAPVKIAPVPTPTAAVAIGAPEVVVQKY